MLRIYLRRIWDKRPVFFVHVCHIPSCSHKNLITVCHKPGGGGERRLKYEASPDINSGACPAVIRMCRREAEELTVREADAQLGVNEHNTSPSPSMYTFPHC